MPTSKRKLRERRKRTLATSSRGDPLVHLQRMLAMYNTRFDAGEPYPFGDGVALRMFDPCVYCGERTAMTLDHLEPRRNGRTPSGRYNLEWACRRCNASKYSTPLLQYLAERAVRRERWRTGRGLSPGQFVR